MFLINAEVLNGDFKFEKLDIEIEDGIIVRLGHELNYSEQDLVVDCQGFYITPGFIDLHVHGAAGFDCSDGSREAVEGVAKFLVEKGVTSFCPTTMTMPLEPTIEAVKSIKDCMDKPCEGARVLGINMEGPFLSSDKKGAQKADNIIEPDYNFFKQVYDACGGIIKLVDIAPENDKDGEFTKKVAKHCVVSIAHSTAGYDQAKEAFDNGITHATHLFNAMTGFSHREPGVVGAVFDDKRVKAELICDGHHVHPAALRTAFKLLGDRAVVVSDSMRANGLEEGVPFDLGGQDVTVMNGKATLKDGTIAGSVTNLHQEIKNLVSYGISLEQAVKAASLIPAIIVGMDHEIGSIEQGKRSDLVLMDEELNIAAVYH